MFDERGSLKFPLVFFWVFKSKNGSEIRRSFGKEEDFLKGRKRRGELFFSVKKERS